MGSESWVPSRETFNQFGAGLIAPLGGRLNKHWLVELPTSPQERFVLRRWSTPSVSNIAYWRVAALGDPFHPRLAIRWNERDTSGACSHFCREVVALREHLAGGDTAFLGKPPFKLPSGLYEMILS